MDLVPAEEAVSRTAFFFFFFFGQYFPVPGMAFRTDYPTQPNDAGSQGDLSLYLSSPSFLVLLFFSYIYIYICFFSTKN